MGVDGQRRFAWAMVYKERETVADLRERLDILIPLCRELIHLEVYGKPFQRWGVCWHLQQVLDEYEHRQAKAS